MTSVARFFSEKIGKFYVYDFSTLLSKFYWLTLIQFMTLGPRELSRDLFLIGGNEISRFSRFLEHSKPSMLCYEICMVARCYQDLTINIKSLVINALFLVEMRLKVLILAILLRFLALFKLFVRTRAFNLSH